MSETQLEPVRVGLVGLGGHGRTICDAAEASGLIEVRAVYDTDTALAEEMGARFGCAVAPEYETLVLRDDLEAVVLVTPNSLHRRQSEAAFARGLHVFVEKPIANTVADGHAIIDAAARGGRRLMVGHNMRFGPAIERVKDVIAQGRIGEPVSVELHFSADNTHRMDPGAWRLQPDQCPLLPVMQLGIHGIDLIHFFLDTITEVYAFTRSVTTAPGVIDSVSASFRLGSGVVGTMVSNYCTQILFEYRIAGTLGSVRGTPHRFWFRANADTDGHGDGPVEELDFSERDRESYRRQLDVFAEAVRTDLPLHPDGWDGLRALAVVEALQRSSETGRPSEVPAFELPSPVE